MATQQISPPILNSSTTTNNYNINNNDSTPVVPPRPTTTSMNTGTTNRNYGSYGTGYSPYSSYNSYGSSYGGSYGSSYGSSYGGVYGSPYSRYGSYSSPYSRYGSYGGGYGGYGSYNSYGSPYNRFGHGSGGGGMMGPGGPDEMSLTQRMEANTAAGFQMIESIVNAFGGFAQMLESTYFATHSSFMAMVGVVDQFGSLRNYLGQVLSIFALIRWIKHLFYKLTGRQPPVDPSNLNVADYQQFQEQRKYSRRPLLFFVIAVFGLPYLMHKFIHAFSAGRPNLEMCQATYDFRGESQVELTFQRGDIIAILSKVDMWGQPSQWWRGRLRNGEQGLFPANYVEIIKKEDNINNTTTAIK
ncbi:13491_t:CDS:2 [Entrophospora sp. SA101]|nr:1531_t:CDS:2 [Entrophospora sp. SA101]CAJ0838450.1 13491_t:CDS:2 [Entrophospora sp. SA101]CAJ0847032.1 9757_t:CDS:2 [Entrophospora sp. SA101]CAJ0920139.1 21319_t:CDS:2 [Entrophospora sp. SA101]CAJ0920152.1 21324_t:CDS:2 [Entrophospora sp. SA101]